MRRRLAIAALAVVALAASPAGGVAPRRSLLDSSRHNFMASGTQPAGMDACQFCHPPNRMKSVKTKAPAWDPQFQGQSAALDQRADPNGPPLPLRWAGSTMRCLSCHDGTVSSKNIVYRPSSLSLRADVAADLHRARGARGLYLSLPEDWNFRIMGNHPVSVPYPLEGAQSEYAGYGVRATPLARDWVPDPRVNGLKLFRDTSGFDALRGTAGVECASCHDPHGTGNAFFLRVPREGSRLCLSCHRK